MTVTTLLDEDDGDLGLGAGDSLREAVYYSNPGDTVNFAVTGVIALDLGWEVLIDKDLTIDGPGAGKLTVDGNDWSRLFIIDGLGTDISVMISGITLANGRGWEFGGAIRSNARLTLADSMIIGGSALYGGGIYSEGPLSLTDCVISGSRARDYGGGIWSGDELTLERCEVSDNMAGVDGGGVYSLAGAESTLLVRNSVVLRNEATGGVAGGILGVNLMIQGGEVSLNIAGANGGGIYGGDVTVRDCEIAGNVAGNAGGGIAGDNVDVSYCLVAGNRCRSQGGGICAANTSCRETEELELS